MWPIMFEMACTAIAVALCSCAVKLIDDFLDRERDNIAGRANWATIFGNGTMVYAILLLTVAAGINAPVALSLFLASYVIGMFNDLGRLLPSRLTGWQESLIVFCVGGMLFSWHLMIFSLLFVMAIQLFDDCIDIHTDALCGQRNFACRLGWLECLVLALISLLSSYSLDETVFIPVFAGTVSFYLLSLRLQGVSWR